MKQLEQDSDSPEVYFDLNVTNTYPSEPAISGHSGLARLARAAKVSEAYVRPASRHPALDAIYMQSECAVPDFRKSATFFCGISSVHPKCSAIQCIVSLR